MQLNRNITQYESPEEAQLYGEEAESYALIGDMFGKAVGVTECTIKTLAKATADNLVIPVESHIATKIIVPVGTYVAKEIVVPVGEHVAKEIALPMAIYIAKHIALPIAKKVSVEIKDLTAELMKGLTEQIKEAVKQEIDVMQNKIKALPSEIMEGIKSSIKFPFGAPAMEILDDDYD